MTAIEIILCLVLIIVAIVLIITVLLQQGQRQGLGAIGGGAETFFGKNKAKSYEGKLAQLTKICAVIFIVLSILATIVFNLPEKSDDVIIDPVDVEVTDDAADETVDETTDETVDETADETVDETTDETVDETADETDAETDDEATADETSEEETTDAE